MSVQWGLLALCLVLLCQQITGRCQSVAIVTPFSYSSVHEMHADHAYHCHWHNHEQYCREQGYECFLVLDSHGAPNDGALNEWQQEIRNDPFQYAPHWFKIFLLRRILPKFDAVVVVDSDVLFQFLKMPLGDLLAEAGDRWWILPDSQGINSHVLMLKNTRRSRAAVEHLWQLRHVCPRCPQGEQCAVHVLLHELLADWALAHGRTQLYITSDKGQPCCNPAMHCRHPGGLPMDVNEANSTAVQGCTWAWWQALNSPQLKETHRHIYWVPQPPFPRALMNVLHPVKALAACTHHNPAWDSGYVPKSMNTTEFLRQMRSLPDLQAVEARPKWELAARVGEVYVGGRIPLQLVRLCHVVRFNWIRNQR